MILDELRQEAAGRASSPEGMMTLVHALLTQFDEVKEPDDHDWSWANCLIDRERLARVFSKINDRGIGVNLVEFNFADYEYILNTGALEGHLATSEVTGKGDRLWAAEVRVNPKLHRNCVLITDDNEVRHHKRWYSNPENHLRKLMRSYVLCKRQYEYWRKKNSRFIPTLHTQHAEAKFKISLASFKERIDNMSDHFHPIDFQRIMTEAGRHMSFGTFREPGDGDGGFIGMGMPEEKDTY